MKMRRRLTPAEDRALGDLVKMVARILGPSWMKKASRNPGPERITVSPGLEARMMLDTNRLLVRALNVLSKKTPDSRRDPIMKRETSLFLAKAIAALSRDIKVKLSGPKPISRLIVTGNDAKLYFGALEWAHARWSLIRKNYIDAATDIRFASDHATRVLWIVRSILNVGHPPVEQSRFMKGHP